MKCFWGFDILEHFWGDPRKPPSHCKSSLFTIGWPKTKIESRSSSCFEIQIQEIGMTKLQNWSFEVLNWILHYAGTPRKTLNQISLEVPKSRLGWPETRIESSRSSGFEVQTCTMKFLRGFEVQKLQFELNQVYLQDTFDGAEILEGPN